MLKSLDPHSLLARKEESAAKGDFVNEDLPYHIRRIYLKGSNLQDDPWAIYDDSEFAFQQIKDFGEIQLAFNVAKI
jgi:hypothetical protein